MHSFLGLQSYSMLSEVQVMVWRLPFGQLRTSRNIFRLEEKFRYSNFVACNYKHPSSFSLANASSGMEQLRRSRTYSQAREFVERVIIRELLKVFYKFVLVACVFVILMCKKLNDLS